MIYAYLKKTRRGYYEMEFALLENNPVETQDGEITERHTRWLEKQISETESSVKELIVSVNRK